MRMNQTTAVSAGVEAKRTLLAALVLVAFIVSVGSGCAGEAEGDASGASLGSTAETPAPSDGGGSLGARVMTSTVQRSREATMPFDTSITDGADSAVAPGVLPTPYIPSAAESLLGR